MDRRKKSFKRGRGFTLIEALVAIGILTASISGFLALSQMSAVTASVAKDRMIASYLAQDAMEYIKMIQQENFMLSDGSPGWDWLYGLWACESSNETATCIIDSYCHDGFDGNVCIHDESSGFFENFAIACDSECPYLRYNVNTGFYGYGTGPQWIDTKFRRTIKMREITLLEDNDYKDEAMVSVVVTWERKGRTHTIEARHNMFNIN